MLLSKINSPADLKKIPFADLPKLAQEIRAEIIKVVAQNGGHLAPNLGVVEMTIALHRVFTSPHDKIIWDVGHQSYVHRLLTGFREEFPTLRQLGGLSGFPKRDLSPHDAFDTGHSSTSISAALGIALARDLQNEKYNVIAVIGDGALTGGMSFEALNYAGHLKTDLIVILNDNEMSIAENVGAMAGYLSRMRTDPKYSRSKDEIEFLVNKIPAIGPTVLKALERVKDSFKYLMVPGMIFEELGFTYLGPINGHDIGEVKTVLERAKSVGGPVMVHLLTQKGRGYTPAEKNPDKFHGIGPFQIKTGETYENGGPSYTSVFSEALVELGEEDEKILAITAAMPSGTGLSRFAEIFPDRYFDVGIAEQHAVTMAAGLASQGFKPVVAVYSTFLQRAYDQILHDVCLTGLPVVFAIDRAGIVGEDGPTHQGLFDIAYLRHIPNVVVMAPKDENELRQMLKTAIMHNGPVAIRYPRGKVVGVPKTELPVLPIGEAEILREGRDVAIMAIGTTVYPSLQAAEILQEQGIEATVVNMRFAKPLDEKVILKCAAGCRKIITVEEHVLAGGFGSAVLEVLEKENVSVPVERIGIPDEFVEHGPSGILREKYGLTAGKIAAKAGHIEEKVRIRAVRKR